MDSSFTDHRTTLTVGIDYSPSSPSKFVLFVHRARPTDRNLVMQVLLTLTLWANSLPQTQKEHQWPLLNLQNAQVTSPDRICSFPSSHTSLFRGQVANLRLASPYISLSQMLHSPFSFSVKNYKHKNLVHPHLLFSPNFTLTIKTIDSVLLKVTTKKKLSPLKLNQIPSFYLLTCKFMLQHKMDPGPFETLLTHFISIFFFFQFYLPINWS